MYSWFFNAACLSALVSVSWKVWVAGESRDIQVEVCHITLNLCLNSMQNRTSRTDVCYCCCELLIHAMYECPAIDPMEFFYSALVCIQQKWIVLFAQFDWFLNLGNINRSAIHLLAASEERKSGVRTPFHQKKIINIWLLLDLCCLY